MKNFICPLIMGLFVPCLALAGTVKSLNAKRTEMKLELSSVEKKKFRKGDTIGIIGADPVMKTLGKITKIKGSTAYVTVEKGFRDWKEADTFKLKNEGTNWRRIYGMKNKAVKKNRSTSPMFSVLPEVGTAVFPVPSLGLTAGYNLSKDMALELNVSKGEKEFSEQRYDSDPFGISTNLSTTVISARLKKFWTKNIYTNSGLGYRDVTFSGKVSGYDGQGGVTLDSLSDGDELFAASRKDAVVDLAVGSRWQSSNFTFGIDLIGALIPVAQLGGQDPKNGSVSVASENANPAGADATPGEGYEDYYEYDLPGVSYQAKVYFGISF